MLSRYDPDEVRRRAAAVRAVRDMARARRRRRAPTVRDYNKALGDEAGMSYTSRVDQARQERKEDA